MFYGCTNFNKNLSNWDVSKVTDMMAMFFNCILFNKDLSKWVVRNDTDMTRMFHDDSIMEISYKPRKTNNLIIPKTNTQPPNIFSNFFKFFKRSTSPTVVKV